MFPLVKTLQSLLQIRIIILMLICSALAVLVILGLTAGITWLSDQYLDIQNTWLARTLDVSVAVVLLVIGWFMLPALTVLLAGVFQERVIAIVEKKSYPDRVRREEPRFWPDMLHDIKFTLWALFLNGLVLPLYFIGIGFIISILLNTYLLGREFFESAAGYHLGKPQTRQIRKANRVPVYAGGAVITMLELIPFVNCVMPIIAMVWMVHVYQSIEPLTNHSPDD